MSRDEFVAELDRAVRLCVDGGLASLTLSCDGEPLRAEPLDGFAFAIREQFRRGNFAFQ
jgi:hypothetical protein